MPNASRLVTADELEKFPSDDRRCELVEGRVITMTPVGFEDGRIVFRFGSVLDRHVRAGNLGVLVTEVGFTLQSNPDTVLAPDLAFLRRERIPAIPPRGFWKGPPDLAVEVLSPDDRPREIRAKVEEYLTRGVPLVLVVDADAKTVTIYRPSTPPIVLMAHEVLDLGDIVPGFRCRVGEIFA